MGLELGPASGDRALTPRQMIAIGAVAGLAMFGLYKLGDGGDNHVEKIEQCVSELLDRDIILTTVANNGRIKRPTEIYDEVTACIRTSGDAEKAEILLDE